MGNSFRLQTLRFYKYIINRVVHQIDNKNLERSAIVFSPHQDDETLGCGGTIIKKKKIGAAVEIVFMTDGSRSHRHLISENALKSIRAKEALAACSILGVEKNNIIFLDFKDGELKKNQNSAIQKVIEIIQQKQPDEIFIPWRIEAHPDHLATNRIVLSALQMYQKEITIYKYPIYFWLHWPWIRLPRGPNLKILDFFKKSLTSFLNFFKEFGYSFYIGDVLKLKRTAINKYHSQTTRLIPDPRWWTLSDISNGDWLKCFFQDYEIYC